MRLSVDVETASLLNLRRVGAWKYAAHESTRIVCLAWAIDGDDPDIWYPIRSAAIPVPFVSALANPAIEIHAWNAQFEFAVLTSRLFPQLALEHFHCSMARALYWGVPAALEQAARILQLNVRKDQLGHGLMMRMNKPRGYAKDGAPRWWHEEDDRRLTLLGEYCAQDVRTERAVARSMPPMPNHERAVWLLDQRMNAKGMRVDTVAVAAMQRIVDQETKRIGRELAEVTEGAATATTHVGRLLKWLQADGLPLDSLDKRALPARLKEFRMLDEPPPTPRQQRAIDLYQTGAKTSTAKLRAMADYMSDDGRIRSLIQYGGAMRTLRWAGRGPQIQNYPRPLMAGAESNWIIDDMIRGVSAEALAMTHGGAGMDLVSRCLRGAFIPAPGHVFVVGDYSAIEARVVAWLAGQKDLLDVFRAGEDPYVFAAKQQGSSDRQFGKVLVLACGYGMGAWKFIDTAAGYGIVLTFDAAKTAVDNWREKNKKTKGLWYAADAAARQVIPARSTDREWCGEDDKLSFRMGEKDGRFRDCMLMELPSGRDIVYRQPRLMHEPTDENPDRTVIRYAGMSPTRQWTRIQTWGGKLIENATQAIARDLLADALLRLADCWPVATIHDEIICEPPAAEAASVLQRMLSTMSEGPAWAEGLPLAAEAKIMTRYGKG